MQLRYLAMAVLPEIPPPKRSDESMHLPPRGCRSCRSSWPKHSTIASGPDRSGPDFPRAAGVFRSSWSARRPFRPTSRCLPIIYSRGSTRCQAEARLAGVDHIVHGGLFFDGTSLPMVATERDEQ
jgi:hypothetical protein